MSCAERWVSEIVGGGWRGADDKSVGGDVGWVGVLGMGSG